VYTMPDYRRLTVAARNLQATEDTLIDFNRAGWIDVTVKDGCQFISGQDEYRARFILHLRQKLELTDKEIGIVLSNEKPPYSLDQVPSILARHAAERIRK
jgi:hypothetical protein